MQTFLPYPDYDATAAVLDRQRLGKQRVENLKIMRALLGLTDGWAKHVVTRMWAGATEALRIYHEAICWEWVARGYKDNCLDEMCRLHLAHGPFSTGQPLWMHKPGIHVAYRSLLLRKAPEHYRQHWPDLSDSIEINYPVANSLST